MNKFIVLVFLISCSLSFALEWCDNLDSYMNRGYSKEEVLSALEVDRHNHFENECISEGGEGSRFGYSGSWVSECGGSVDAVNGFWKSNVTCDFCSGFPITSELELTENDCREDCKESNLTCQHPSFPNQWGGEVVKKNPNGSVCGIVLPDCAESSSSSAQSSSSSGKSSSSQSKSSSSHEAPSSSTDGNCEGDGCTSEIEQSSSSEHGNFSSNSAKSGDIIMCGICSDGGGYSPWLTFFDGQPRMLSKIKLLDIKPICRNGVIIMRTNIPRVRFLTYRGMCYNTSCESSYWDDVWYCEYEPNTTENGCRGVDETESRGDGSWEVFYSVRLRRIVNEDRKGYATFDESELFAKVAQEGIAADGTTDGYGSMDLKDYFKLVRPELSISTFDDYVEACALYSGIDLNEPSSSASSLDGSSSSVEIDWDYYSSSSEEPESSSSEESSSSVESSNSEESSSGSEPESSSSEPESSSSVLEESSSSYVEAETFVPGGDQVYTPDQVFNDGLQNMEDGKCYSLNPDRGTVYGWDLSLNAQDPWWWREVDCNTGKKPVKAGIGVCAAYPDTVPENETACYAYNGSCYVCDNSRDYVDCSQSWLWMYNFPGHDWFKKVDCYDPYEEEEDIFSEQCGDSRTLYKQNNSKSEYIKEIFLNATTKKIGYYDVLGRKTKKAKFIQLYNLDLSPLNIKLAQQILSGHTDATIYFDYCNKRKEKISGGWRYTFDVSMVVKVTEAIGLGNLKLQAHEDKHKEIYLDQKMWGTWYDQKVEIPRDSPKQDKCKKIVKSFWDSASMKLSSLFMAQNSWDYNDQNNVGHLSYPDVSESVEEIGAKEIKWCVNNGF